MSDEGGHLLCVPHLGGNMIGIGPGGSPVGGSRTDARASY